MSNSQKPASPLGSWQALEKHQEKMRSVHMRELFVAEPNRFDLFSLQIDGLLLDYSRNIVTCKTMSLLLDLARESGVEVMRQKMFAGEHLNNTEDRAALHVALRAEVGDEFRDGKQDCTADVQTVLD
ncbi:MAG: glucose-6-phosphate isomerase, partial [Gammaproteobacteria bacterium]